MKKYLFSILAAFMAVLLTTLPVAAATTQDITVTAVPAFVEISCNQSSYAFGVVSASSTPYTATNWGSITNTSTVQTDQSISVSGNWTGGVGWTHSDTATPGENTAGMLSNRGGTWGSGDITITIAGAYVYENCPASTNYTFGLKLIAPTGFTDAVQKTITVSISAAAG